MVLPLLLFMTSEVITCIILFISPHSYHLVLFCFVLSYLILSYHVLSSILNSFYFLQFIFLCSVFFISYTVFYCPSHLIKSPPPNQFLTSHTFKTFLIDHINSIFISSLFPFFLTYNLFYYHFAFYQIL